MGLSASADLDNDGLESRQPPQPRLRPRPRRQKLCRIGGGGDQNVPQAAPVRNARDARDAAHRCCNRALVSCDAVGCAIVGTAFSHT